MSTDIWKNHEIFITADGSPTLVSLDSHNLEPMHNRAGALSETDWIYGEATRFCLANFKKPVRCFSVGLGLGYNELMFAALCLKADIRDSVSLYSVESNSNLAESFLSFLFNKHEQNESIYEIILQTVSKKYAVEPRLVKNFLTNLYTKQHWILKGTLSFQTIPKQKFGLIYYDAFSSKTSPELWSEEFLQTFLTDTTEDFCVFASYAATGILKRSLFKSNFKAEFLAGFHGKRERTLAIRSG